MISRAPSHESQQMEMNCRLEWVEEMAREFSLSRAAGHLTHFVVQKSAQTRG